MKSKMVLVAALAGVFSAAGASADTLGPSAADETTPSMTTVTSYDHKTGGYRGWGPMANPQTPYSPNEGMPPMYAEEMRDRAQQLAEVTRLRDQMWVANAPLRAPYENTAVGATRSEGSGSGGFFQRNAN